MNDTFTEQNQRTLTNRYGKILDLIGMGIMIYVPWSYLITEHLSWPFTQNCPQGLLTWANNTLIYLICCSVLSIIIIPFVIFLSAFTSADNKPGNGSVLLYYVFYYGSALGSLITALTLNFSMGSTIRAQCLALFDTAFYYGVWIYLTLGLQLIYLISWHYNKKWENKSQNNSSGNYGEVSTFA